MIINALIFIGIVLAILQIVAVIVLVGLGIASWLSSR
jgi:hypothetical protein